MRSAAYLLFAGGLSACATIQYFGQAAYGEASVLARARPISAVLDDPNTKPALAKRLELAERIRRFAVTALKLPDNASYTRYANIGRPYVVWNIVSAPPLSLMPDASCYPVVGCFAYRGYYSEAAARAYARRQKNRGEDVFLYGVPAYSTLGWFADPLLSTTVRYGEMNLARLIFHELAHQEFYLDGDSAFNEAYATAIEMEGAERWLAVRRDPALTAAYRVQEVRQAQFQNLMEGGRKRLESTYASDAPSRVKLKEKADIQHDIDVRYQALKRQWRGYDGYDVWFRPQPNNAHFASLATYLGLVPAFRELLHEQGNDFSAFYAAVRKLAKKNRAARDQALAALSVAADSGEMQHSASAQSHDTALRQ